MLDLLGRPVPHQLSTVELAAVAPGMLHLFDRRVPAVRVFGDPDWRWVMCHCNRGHRVDLGLTEADCGRWFLAGNRYVHVWKPSWI